jgi:LPS export ABC transporter protein LptC
VKVYFYGADMEVTNKIKANYGIKYEKSDKTIVRNDVVVVNENGERLYTEELTWDKAEGKIYTDKFVRIKTETETLFGQGLQSDEKFTKYQILNPEGPIKVILEDDKMDEDF